MFKLILQRVISLPFILFGVAVLTFSLARLSPFDPISAYVGAERGVSSEVRAQIGRTWGLDQPPPQQFVNWLGQVLQGNFGNTRLYAGQPVLDVIGGRIGASARRCCWSAVRWCWC